MQFTASFLQICTLKLTRTEAVDSGEGTAGTAGTRHVLQTSKSPEKAAHACAMRYFLTYSNMYVYLSPSQLTFLGLRVQVSNCQTIAPDYPVGQPSKKQSFVRFPGFV